MSDEQLSTPSEDVSLVEAFEESLKEKRRAGLTVGIGIALVCICFSLSILISSKNFFEHKLPDVAAIAANHFAQNSGRYSKQFVTLLEKSGPAYVDALLAEFAKEKPALDALAKKEFHALEQHFEANRPRYHNTLMSFAKDQEQLFFKDLGLFLSPEEARRIAETYRSAFESKVPELANDRLKQFIENGKQLQKNLMEFAEAEPDIPRPINKYEAIGLVLELMGVELQDFAVKYPNQQ